MRRQPLRRFATNDRVGSSAGSTPARSKRKVGSAAVYRTNGQPRLSSQLSVHTRYRPPQLITELRHAWHVGVRLSIGEQFAEANLDSR